MKKYLCLKPGDNFVTEDEEDAFIHIRKGHGHDVVEIDFEDGVLNANLIEGEIPLELGEEEE